MNSFGKNFRVQIFGQSHSEIVGVTLDGIPPGIPVAPEDFKTDLDRRRPGAKATTPRKEADEPLIKTGVFNGMSAGSPMTIFFENNNTRSSDYEKHHAFPRPGHADFVATEKYKGFEDYRGGGHFSGRLTVCLVAAGVVAKKIIRNHQLGQLVRFETEILEVGGEQDIEKGIEKAVKAKDSVGGIIECRIKNIPVGVGEPFFDSVESVISHLIFAVPAIKGIEFGSGFAAARMFGSEHNDPILDLSGTTGSNNAGGVTGGITNGNEIVFRVVVKPTSSTPKVQETLNRETGQVEEFSVKGRHDLCIALRAPVVIEAAAAIGIADLLMETDMR
ncbi:MAG: chorismate synthase [Chitinophagaceae bacterium]|nr:chorismate synthase [Chitinophagaceae bacterium]